MKVRHLIAELQQLDPEAYVFARDDDANHDDAIVPVLGIEADTSPDKIDAWVLIRIDTSGN